MELAKALESDFPHMKDQARELEAVVSQQVAKLGEMQRRKTARRYDWSTLIVGAFFSIPLGILAWWLWSRDGAWWKVAGVIAGLVTLILAIGTIGATFSPTKKAPPNAPASA